MGAPIGPPFLLPERDRLFYAIDRLAARGEGVVPMRCACRYADRDVTDVEFAHAMNCGKSDTAMFSGYALED